jgi:demethylmenaquinone methyltransferase/2-methoxy-6-polyprenyl-1,4-benzoquinol methylase
MAHQSPSTLKVQPQIQSNNVCAMFDRIAPKYDLLNHILSFGLDILWRRKLARLVKARKSNNVIDLATGTGDVLIELSRTNNQIEKLVGLDLSENMLDVCRRKLKKSGIDTRKLELIVADASNTNLPSDSFDTVTMAFGIRNTADVRATLHEIARILKPKGTVFILEFSMLSNWFVKPLFVFYLRYLVPLVGRLISGDKHAYRYLDSSIESFHRPEQFRQLMQETGFSDVKADSLTFGVAYIYSGHKP